MQKVTDPALLAQLNGGAPVARQTAPRAPLANPRPVDPSKEAADARADRAEGRAERSEGRTVKETQFNQQDRLRSDYNALPVVKEYRTAVQALASALKRGNDGSGDTALIYDYVKALDPTSVVREAEVGMASSGGGVIDAKVAQFKRELGIEGGGTLSPEVRQRLRREIITSTRQRVRQYNQQREQFAKLAKDAGYDPYDIIGNHDADPYVEAFREYDKRNKIGQFAEDKGIPTPDMVGGGSTPGGFAAPDRPDSKVLGPGEKFVYDENGQPFGIVSESGEWISAYSEIANDAEYIARMEKRAKSEGLRDPGSGGIGQSVDAFVRGAADIPTFGFADEIAAAGDTLFNGGTMDDNLAYQRYIDQRDSENNTAARLTGQIAGAVAVPMGRAGPATTGQMAKEGAVFGAGYGFGSGEDGLVNRSANALLGGATGGIAGGVIGRAINSQPVQRGGTALNALMQRRAPNVDRAVVEAGERQGVPIRLPDAVESRRNAFAALQKSRSGGPAVALARADDNAAIQGRLSDIQGRGSPRDEFSLGQSVQQAMERKNVTDKAAVSRRFEAVDKLAPDARGDGAQTLSFIDAEIAALRKAGPRGNASAIKALEDMKADIAETGLSVSSLQSLRQSVRQRATDNGLDMTAAGALFSRVDEAATKELEGVLGSVNPNAVGRFRAANKGHAERLAFRREVARELLGTDKSPVKAETAARRLMSKIASAGDEKGFARVWQALDKSERDDVAATIVDNLAGKSDEFSLAKLANNLDSLNMRTVREVFGADGARALNDIRLIARRKTQTAQNLNNSNTGAIVEQQGNALQDILMASLGYSQGGFIGAMTMVGARNAGEKASNSWRARLMLNPNWTKWLKDAPQTSRPQVIDRYFKRLNDLSTKGLVAANDVDAFVSLVRESALQAPGRAAAEGDEEN